MCIFSQIKETWFLNLLGFRFPFLEMIYKTQYLQHLRKMSTDFGAYLQKYIEFTVNRLVYIGNKIREKLRVIYERGIRAQQRNKGYQTTFQYFVKLSSKCDTITPCFVPIVT